MNNHDLLDSILMSSTASFTVWEYFPLNMFLQPHAHCTWDLAENCNSGAGNQIWPENSVQNCVF